MGIHVDTSEVDRLAFDLRHADRRIETSSRRVIADSARDIRRGMARDFSGHRYAPYIQDAVDFEMLNGPDGFGAEIGVNKAKRQGGLGNILAFGTRNNAPVVDHTAALVRETPDFIRRLEDAAEDAVLGDS